MRRVDDAPARLRALGPLPAPDGRAPRRTSSTRSCPTCPASAAAASRASPLDVPDLAHAAAALPRRPRHRQGRRSSATRWAARSSASSPTTTPSASSAPCSSRRRAGCTTSRCAAPIRQLARDGVREPPAAGAGRGPRLPAVRRAEHDAAVPGADAVSRRSTGCSRCSIPTLVVLGERDPLMPEPRRIQEIASQTDNHVLLVVIEGAAHAINFSHPGELANVIRLFMADQPIVDDPDSPGTRAPTRSTAASTCLRRPRPTGRPEPDTSARPRCEFAPLRSRSLAPWPGRELGVGRPVPMPRPRGHR